jgi:hypothetical protein
MEIILSQHKVKGRIVEDFEMLSIKHGTKTREALTQ